MNENRKVINATPTEYKGIPFKSALEKKLFMILEEEGLNPQYEPTKYHIWEGFKPSIPFYIGSSNATSLKLDNKKIMDITYTPDIVFNYKGYTVFVEIKPAYCNDVFPYKKKLFRKLLEDLQVKKSSKFIYAQIGTAKRMQEFIKILKEEYNA